MMNTHQLNNTPNTYPNNGRPLLPSSNYPKPMVVTPHPQEAQKKDSFERQKPVPEETHSAQKAISPPEKKGITTTTAILGGLGLFATGATTAYLVSRTGLQKLPNTVSNTIKEVLPKELEAVFTTLGLKADAEVSELLPAIDNLVNNHKEAMNILQQKLSNVQKQLIAATQTGGDVTTLQVEKEKLTQQLDELQKTLEKTKSELQTEQHNHTKTRETITQQQETIDTLQQTLNETKTTHTPAITQTELHTSIDELPPVQQLEKEAPKPELLVEGTQQNKTTNAMLNPQSTISTVARDIDTEAAKLLNLLNEADNPEVFEHQFILEHCSDIPIIKTLQEIRNILEQAKARPNKREEDYGIVKFMCTDMQTSKIGTPLQTKRKHIFKEVYSSWLADTIKLLKLEDRNTLGECTDKLKHKIKTLSTRQIQHGKGLKVTVIELRPEEISAENTTLLQLLKEQLATLQELNQKYEPLKNFFDELQKNLSQDCVDTPEGAQYEKKLIMTAQRLGLMPNS